MSMLFDAPDDVANEPSRVAAQPSSPAGGAKPTIGSEYGAWAQQMSAIARRSWRSALLLTAVGVGVPYGFAGLVSYWSSWGESRLSIFHLTAFADRAYYNTGPALLTLGASVVAAIIATVAWAGGVWALVTEAETGRRADLRQAVRYGQRRLPALLPWSLALAVAYTIGDALLWLPGLYVAYVGSVLCLVVLFEKARRPLRRAVAVTHDNGTWLLSALRIGTLLLAANVWYLLVTAAEAVLGTAWGLVTHGAFGRDFGFGIFSFVSGLMMAPAFALLLVGLVSWYFQVRAPATSAHLREELEAAAA